MTNHCTRRLFSSPPVQLASALLSVLLLGTIQSAAAYELRSWSYLNQSGSYLMDDHYLGDPSTWQGSSGVQYNTGNFAKSSIGFASDGSLAARIGVSATAPETSQAYSSSFYRDNGWSCAATQCGTAVPLGASFTARLSQDGSFTLGSANFSLSYYLRTASASYDFHFAVQQGEMELAPYGWFSIQTDSSWVTYGLDDPMFHLVWEDSNQDGIYNFSYDFSFTGNTHGVDLGEELLMSASVYGGEDRQFVERSFVVGFFGLTQPIPIAVNSGCYVSLQLLLLAGGAEVGIGKDIDLGKSVDVLTIEFALQVVNDVWVRDCRKLSRAIVGGE